MAKATEIEYSLKELAGLMVRDQGITEGHWMILVRFTHQAANLSTSEDDMAPVVMNRIVSLGIQRVPQPTPLSVDATTIREPKPRAKSKVRAS